MGDFAIPQKRKATATPAKVVSAIDESSRTSAHVGMYETTARSSAEAGPAVDNVDPPPKTATAGEFPELPYSPPSWSAVPAEKLSLEVLKEGSILERIDISAKENYVVGRLPNCEIQQEHPSLSRYHAVLQHGDDGGLYIYDLGSTHGTQLNKTPVEARKYYRVRLGHVIRFGASSRLFVVVASDELMAEEEERVAGVVEQIRAQRAVKHAAVAAKEAEREAAREAEREAIRSAGVGWGLDDEAPDDGAGDGIGRGDASLMAKAVAASGNAMDGTDRDSFYSSDPKKALASYFDREHENLEYQVEADGPSHAKVYTCKIRLPVVGSDDLEAEASLQGKRKEAIAAAALVACRMLDAKGVLRASEASEVRKIAKKARRARDDDGDDTFFDRTGDVEAKQRRKRQRAENKAQTYESLSARRAGLLTELMAVKDALATAAAAAKAADTASDMDPLDAFMSGMGTSVSSDALNRSRRRERELLREMNDVDQLLALVTPALAPVVATTATKLGAADAPSKENPVAEGSDPAVVSLSQTRQAGEGVPARAVALAPTTSSGAPGADAALSVDAAVASSSGGLIVQENAATSSGVPARGADAALSVDAAVASSSGGLIVPKKKSVVESLPASAVPPLEKKVYGMARGPPPGWEASNNTTSSANSELDPETESGAAWVPPEGQSGDGMTALNAKLGY